MTRRASPPIATPSRRSRAAEITAALAPVATVAGLPPGDSRTAPQVVLGGIISAMARDLGMHLSSADIFLQGGAIVTVNGGTGAVRTMESIRFCSWVEKFVSFVQAGKDGMRPVSISAELSAKILASDEFRDALRPLRAVVLVRLPVWQDDKQNAVRLLPAGYDPVTETFTVDALAYPDDMDVNEAWDWLLAVYGGFPFAETGELSTRRSMAVQIAAHFAVFCRNMLSQGARPMCCWLGNQPGLGKSLLSRMAIAPVFGTVAIQAFPAKEEELGKLLTASASEGVPYLYFDNVRGRLSSSELESFITSPIRTGRELGTSGTITAVNQASVFVTGNGLSLSPDLARRSCVVDLFLSGEAAERKFPEPITESWLVKPETRQKFLACLWAGLRFWQEQKGCERTEGLVLHGFEEFSQIIGGVVMAMGFGDPMARPEVSLDETGDAWKRLLAALAETVPDGGSLRFTPTDCLDKAEELDAKKAFGQRIKKYRGRELVDGRGRRFEFGQRQRSSASSGYPITILTPAPPDF
jgi:hypothetical protein